MLEIRRVENDDVVALVALWRHCGLLRPWNDPFADIALARRSASSALFVGSRGESGVIASVMTGSDGHRGWLYYLAVHTDWRGNGHGRAMVRHAEGWLRQIDGVPKVQLLIREDNDAVQGFYQKIGYVKEPRVVMSRRLDE